MKIVITGALGHIGSYLIRQLPLQLPGAELIMLDNLSTQRYSSLFDLAKSTNYKFKEIDITGVELQNEFENADVVLHLAAMTDAAGSFERAKDIENNNYNATLKVAETCLETGIPMISLSSTSVYGTQGNVVSEKCSSDDLKPQSPYAVTKLKEEQLLQKMHIEDGLMVCICRFGTIYGTSPGMRFHTAVNKFCWQASMNIPITVWTTAYQQKRPYLALKDANSAIAHIIRRQLFSGEIYNVLTQNSTVKEIVETIKLFVPTLKIDFVDNKIMNQLSYEVSNEKFANTGFNVKGVLKDEVERTISLLGGGVHRFDTLGD